MLNGCYSSYKCFHGLFQVCDRGNAAVLQGCHSGCYRDVTVGVFQGFYVAKNVIIL